MNWRKFAKKATSAKVGEKRQLSEKVRGEGAVAWRTYLGLTAGCELATKQAKGSGADDRDINQFM